MLVAFLHEPNVIAAPEICPNEEKETHAGSLQALSQPVGQFRLAVLGEVVDALLAEVDAADGGVLGGSAADALDDNGGIRLEDDAVVDNLVDGERDEVVVLDDGALVDRLPRLNVRMGSIERGSRSDTHLKSRCSESRRASTVLYSRISFSSAAPMTYIMTSDSSL